MREHRRYTWNAWMNTVLNFLGWLGLDNGLVWKHRGMQKCNNVVQTVFEAFL